MTEAQYWKHQTRLFAALWVSEVWCSHRKEGYDNLRHKARAVVSYDRILNDPQFDKDYENHARVLGNQVPVR